MTLLNDNVFSQSYAEARQKFLAAADHAGLRVEHQIHPLRGSAGEELALDVVRDGPADADTVLLLSSACHGLEGFCGSGVQIDLLQDADWRAAAREAGVAVVYAHGLNPWGFSWLRRTTHENVDMNRNVHDFSRPLPANPAYEELAQLFVPDTWPPSAAVAEALAAYGQRHGAMALQQAISGGQHTHPDGLFYGGTAPCWSQLAVRAMLRQHATRCKTLGWIDVHTGLGPSGHGELIFACRNDPAALARARGWWGDVTSFHDGSSSSAPLTGLMWLTADEECPQAEYTGIAIEFGVQPLPETLDALRADQWLQNHPETPAATRQAIKQQVRDVFYGDTPEWKASILAQSRRAAHAFVSGVTAG
jgi:hypothetical protein